MRIPLRNASEWSGASSPWTFWSDPHRQRQCGPLGERRGDSDKLEPAQQPPLYSARQRPLRNSDGVIAERTPI